MIIADLESKDVKDEVKAKLLELINWLYVGA